MKTLLLAAGAAALALSTGTAMAAARHSAPVALPKQPIPYGELGAYLKASPKQRSSKDWWSGQEFAATGASANTATTVSAGSDVRSTPDAATAALPPSQGGDTVASSPTAAPSIPATPPIQTPAAGQVNPPAAATPETTPPK